MNLLKQSTAATVKFGPFVDSTDGVTAEGSLTISQADIRLSKNGGDFAQTNNAAGATHDEGGYYDVPLDTTDTATLGRLRVAVSESGALPVWQDFLVVPANVYDSLVGGTDKLEVDAVYECGVDLANPVGALPSRGWADSGTAASVTAGSLDLRAGATALGTNVMGGGLVHVWSATTGFSQVGNVASNDAETLTLSDNWIITPTGTVKYIAYVGAPASTAVPVPVNVVQISGDATAADNLESYTDGTTPIPANATQISADATAADNLEKMLDGTGGVTLTTALTGAITGNITGNLSGSVGSVTGAVGSVTGAVGSVTGLTASDVAAIKEKTDPMTYSVANKLNVNVKTIADTDLQGAGVNGNSWRPV